MALTDKLTAIADGFRSSRGTTEKLTLDEMAALAAELLGSDPVLEELTVTENGEYTPGEGVDGFSRVTVEVAGEIPERTAWYRPPDWPDITRLPLDGLIGYFTVDRQLPGVPDEISVFLVSSGSSFVALGDIVNGEFVPVQEHHVAASGSVKIDLSRATTRCPVIKLYDTNYTYTPAFAYDAPIVEAYVITKPGQYANVRALQALTAGRDGDTFSSGGLAARGIPSANLRYLDLSNYTGYDDAARALVSIFNGFKALTVLRFPSVAQNSVLLSAANQSTWPDYAFSGCESLVDLDVSIFDVSEVTRLTSVFANCASLRTLNLSGWDLGKCSGMSNTFQKCTALENLITDGATMPPVSFSLSDCAKLSAESLVGVIAALPVLADGATATLTLGATNTAKLTAEQIAVATEKGWTLA